MLNPPNSNNTQPGQSVPLCVDLDGTLLKADCFYETCIQAAKTNPRALLQTLPQLWQGKAALKQSLTSLAPLAPEHLPANAAVLNHIHEQRRQGTKTYLVTATDQQLAKAIAGHYDCFDGVIASDGKTNLRGNNKAQQLVEHFGQAGFDYIGNDATDIPVWQAARKAYIAATSTPAMHLQTQGRLPAKVELLQIDGLPTHKLLLKALRVHQWSKNLLLLLPMVAGHTWSNLGDWALLLIAFLAMSFCASSVYLLNDLWDLESDRKNQRKRQRPLASGDLQIPAGIALVAICLLCGLGLGLLVSTSFFTMLLMYLGLTTLYTFRLKRVLVLDAIVLAGLYAWRVMLGGAAIDIWPSTWLITFSIFFFFSLAQAKRYAELHNLREQHIDKASGRSYRVSDMEQLATFGTTSGYLSVLVLALYINSEKSLVLYSRPEALYLLCMLVLYWVSRVWILTRRGSMHEDPIVWALKDKGSYFLGIIAAFILALARML